MNPQIKFYYDITSPDSRSLLIFFKLAKIPVEKHMISTKNGKQKWHPKSIKIHLREIFISGDQNLLRLQQIPTIIDGDLELTESIAIIRYMIAKYESSVEDFWYPKDAKKRALIEEYFSWAANNMYTLGENRDDHEMTLLRKFKDPLLITGQRNEKLEKNLNKALDALEEQWMDREFITGNEMTIADLFTACDVEQTSRKQGKFVLIG